MKIFNNTSGGGSVTSENTEPGDIVLSIVNKAYDETQINNISDKWFNISLESYLSEFGEDDIKNPLNSSGIAPQFVTFKKIQTLQTLNSSQITNLGKDKFLFTGWNSSDTQYFIVGVSEKGHSTRFVKIDIENSFCYSSIYNYDNTVYVYRNSVFANDDLMTDTIYKVNLTTLEYETITINNKRICKAYYDIARSKYITHEYNAIDEDDQDETKSGIFVSDDFENTSTAATFEALSNNDGFRFRIMRANITNIGNAMLYTTDGNFLIYHMNEKQLKKYVNGVSSIVIDVLDRTGTKTNIVDQCMILEYDNNYFLCYNHKIDDTSKYKTWVRRKTDLSEVSQYCFCTKLKSFDLNNGFIVKNVFNRDFAHPNNLFGYAIVYQDTDSEKRKVTTFGNSYTYEDANTLSSGFGFWMLKNYFSDINYNEIFNNHKQYIIDDFGTMSASQTYEGNIASFNFDGLGIPGVYAKKMDGNETNKYYLRIRK